MNNKDAKVTVRIEADLLKLFKKWLYDNGMTFSGWLRNKIKQELTNQKKESNNGE